MRRSGLCGLLRASRWASLLVQGRLSALERDDFDNARPLGLVSEDLFEGLIGLVPRDGEPLAL